MNKKNIADQMPEPQNGTWLVCAEHHHAPRVIWRDDDNSHSGFDDERWFKDNNSDPMSWHEILKHADDVYGVTIQPIYSR
jgi:hypothetical protein